MCIVKTPKIKPMDPVAKKHKDPAVIRNPYLDDVNDFAMQRAGRSQLRIDPGSPRRTPKHTRAPLPSSSSPARPRPTNIMSWLEARSNLAIGG